MSSIFFRSAPIADDDSSSASHGRVQNYKCDTCFYDDDEGVLCQRNKQIKEINRQANKKRVTGECKTTNVILGPCCYDEDDDDVLFQIAKQTKHMQLINKNKNK